MKAAKRRTKAFSYDSRDHVWFERVAKEAKSQRPRVNESQMMIDIIRRYFEHKALLKKMIGRQKWVGESLK